MARTWGKQRDWFWIAAAMIAVVLSIPRLSPAPDAEKLADAFADPDRYTALFQLIEIGRNDWNVWLADPENSTAGPELRNHVGRLLKEGRATLIDTAMTVCADGESSQVESGGEFIYPTEGDPAELAPSGTAMTHRVATAYEIRKTGLIVEIEISGPRTRTVDRQKFTTGSEVTFEFERVLRVRDDAHGTGANERKMPVFHTLTQHGITSFLPGNAILISSHRPDKAADETRKSPVVLAFLRLDRIKLDE